MTRESARTSVPHDVSAGWKREPLERVARALYGVSRSGKFTPDARRRDRQIREQAAPLVAPSSHAESPREATTRQRPRSSRASRAEPRPTTSRTMASGSHAAPGATGQLSETRNHGVGASETTSPPTLSAVSSDAAEIGAATGLGSENNVKLAEQGKKPFFNWIDCDDVIATARGGGGGLALWTRTEQP